MNQKKSKSKILLFRLFAATPLLLLVGIGGYIIFSRETLSFGEFIFSDTASPIRTVENIEIDDLHIFEIENRGTYELYALHLTTVREDNFSFMDDHIVDNSLELSSEQDTIYIIFENIPLLLLDPNRPEERVFPERETFILKIFYEFEEIEFKVGNQQSFATEFLFELSEGYQIQIPIQLSEDVVINEHWGNFTVGIFAMPQYNTVNPLAKWYYECIGCFSEFALSNERAGIVRNFSLTLEDNNDLSSIDQESELQGMWLSLSVNPEFQREQFEDLLTSGPPSPWIVSPGDEVKLGFAVFYSNFLNNNSQMTIDDFVIVGLLNWEQIELNGQPYFSDHTELRVNQSLEGYFSITAPEEPGYYDFVAFVIANRNEADNSQFADTALRFTIKVE